jgi:alkylresorcinol/alkylpyrone synthase
MILSPKPGAHIAGVASAFPDTVVGQELAAASLERIFPEHSGNFVRGLVERSGVETRHIVPTVAEMFETSTFTDRNAQYREAAADLAAKACRAALDRAQTNARDIDVIVDVSCTGIAIPALDVALAPMLGLRHDVRRLPITESGCAAGGLALGLAGTLAQNGLRVLVVAVELCSLTMVKGDRSRTNLVASVLFGDGAAAAVVLPGGPGPRIEAVGSHLIPNTQETMGFHVGDHGLQILLQRELPTVLLEHLPSAQKSFLEQHGRSIEDVGLHLIHPGGRRVLDAYTEMHGLDADALRFSRESLRRYGNLSSASILTVLELALEARPTVPEGKEAFLMAIGPGLSLEMMILHWEDARR